MEKEVTPYNKSHIYKFNLKKKDLESYQTRFNICVYFNTFSCTNCM